MIDVEVEVVQQLVRDARAKGFWSDAMHKVAEAALIQSGRRQLDAQQGPGPQMPRLISQDRTEGIRDALAAVRKLTDTHPNLDAETLSYAAAALVVLLSHEVPAEPDCACRQADLTFLTRRMSGGLEYACTRCWRAWLLPERHGGRLR